MVGGTVQLSGGCHPNPCERYGFGIAQYNPNGSLDITFGDGGKRDLDFLGIVGAYALDRLNDGRLVLAGHYGNTDFALTLVQMRRRQPRYQLRGSAGLVRTTFGNDLDNAYAVRVQPDGKILAAGKANSSATGTELDFAATRYLVQGGTAPTATPTTRRRRGTVTPTSIPGDGCDIPLLRRAHWSSPTSMYTAWPARKFLEGMQTARSNRATT